MTRTGWIELSAVPVVLAFGPWTATRWPIVNEYASGVFAAELSLPFLDAGFESRNFKTQVDAMEYIEACYALLATSGGGGG